MTLGLFLTDLERIQEAVDAKKNQSASNQNALSVGYISLDLRPEIEQLEDLVEDAADFADMHLDNAPLASKLREIKGDAFRRPNDAPSLEARIARISRAIRSFGGGAINGDLTAIDPMSTPEIPPQSDAESHTKPNLKRVFIVHGHDEAILANVSRLLERFELEPVVLREQANKGATIIEKFELHAQAGFAVIIMSADDLGASLKEAESKNYKKRARQNVILELGYFMAALKRDRVFVLKAAGVEEPSDILGVVYQPLDEAGAWKFALAKELKAAGYDIDLNKL